MTSKGIARARSGRSVRRGSSTIVSLVGAVDEALLAEVERSPNVVVVRPPGDGLDGVASALAEASGRSAPYAVLAADPMAEAAVEWRAMWDVHAGASTFEERAGEAVAAWRAGRIDLPDYYIVVAEEGDTPDAPHPRDLHLGVLGSVRPARVVPVRADAEELAARVVRALGRLPQGPWWPGLDRVMEAAREFFPGRLVGWTQAGGAPDGGVARRTVDPGGR